MKLNNLWLDSNVSTVMCLPLLSSITSKVFIRRTEIPFPFVQLCFEQGLIKAYLDNEMDGRDGLLTLLFDRTLVNKQLTLTTSHFFSLNELLIESEYFDSLCFMNDSFIAYSFKIPEKFKKDIEIIKSSQYSKLSKEYKKAIKVKNKSIPKTEHPIGYSLVKFDIPYGIAIKAGHIKREIMATLKTKQEADEYYPRYQKAKETFSLNEVKKQIKNVSRFAMVK